MSYLVHPQSLMFNAHRVGGFNQFVNEENIPQVEMLEAATEVAEEWTDSWDEDQGFGGSDMTFMIKDFIDSLVYTNGRSKTYKTDFNPSLEVVKL